MLELPLLLMLSAPTSELDDELVEENAMLKVQLQALEDELREGKRHSYIIVHGYITGSENVMMETMDVDMAKAWCNSHRRCRGFTFGGSDERPGDEVTVTFKAGSKVEHDPNWVSYVKEASMFGAMNLGRLDQAGSPAIIAHGLTFESICIVFALGIALAFVFQRQCRARSRGRDLER